MMEQLKFFLPLGATQAMIALTHSLFNAALARFPNPEVLISAFAVTKSILQMIQNPVSMIKHTVTSLTTDAKSYYKVRRFVALMGFLIVGLFVIFAFTGLSRWIMNTLIGVEGAVLDEAETMLKILVFFPLFVSIRDFYQGVAIKLRMTPVVTIGTFIRVIFVAIMVLLADYFTFLPGSYYAPGIFAIALFIEASTVTIIMNRSQRDIPKAVEERSQKNGDLEEGRQEMNNRLIMMFFIPLLLTAALRTAARPIINAGLARTVAPEIAISAFAVGWSVGVLALAPLMMFHQVPINFLKEKDHPERYQSVKRFAAVIGGSLSLIIGVLGFTPLGHFVLSEVVGTSEVVSTMAADVLKIMAALPIFFVIRQYLWGLFMKRQSTKFVSVGKMVNLVTLVLTVLLGTFIGPRNPALIGASAMVIAEMVECSFLFVAKRKVLGMSGVA
ncbi:hypothetical protein [Isachenkonia alkalipeptolytica]|uniref:Uncharacterized protein n=1 Tax=Isachenkonia alkalipeptolytica TaxID=2565777 RepID=A0AA43XLB8_9CLOT|nr:hypothetical protein [Isachenkonia alkalipeptolytica]NBG88354.1 hypothetical protein [Isachenkonia alkalipeptolytica]